MRTRTSCTALAVAAALLVAACSDSSDETEPADTTVATTTASSAPASTTPSSGSTDGTTDPASAFPVTVPHAFGETTIDAEPARVVTWGWGSADASIALGVVPVAIPFQAYGGDENGVLPWIQEALDEQGATVPEVLPDTDEVPFEAIAAADPDLIIAAYSGITQSDYDLLTQIAPTVAYPGEAWATPWKDLIEIVGTSLGKSDQAAALLGDIDAEIAAQAAANPQLAGKTVAAVWDAAGTFYVYKPADPRVEFMLDLGMVNAPSVDELSTDESTFYFTLGYERLGELTSDVLVSYADTPELSQAFLDSDQGKLMSQVTEGRVAAVTGQSFIASVSPPTALSLTWGLDEYVALLTAAADAVDAAAG
ncbi:MAG: ABC transporter substrate-binding protein [Actinobacteria bacterium]|nr:ABC transporter substrate-binding protein [Actinomycetota bacterium]